MPNAGDVTVRFSVRDQEVVRKALEQLGTDGQAALKKIDAAGQTPSGPLKFLSSILGDVKDRAVGLALPLGGVGQGLIAMGPAGLVAAAALGGVMALFSAVKDGAKAFGEWARAQRDQALATGLSIEQEQAFVALLARHGVEQEKAATALNRFAVNREEAARGGGALYEALRRENAALAEQFAGAKMTEQALNIYAQAIVGADQKTRAFLLNAAFGRGAGLIGPALADLAGQGGIGAVTEALKKAGLVMDESFVKKSAEAATAAQEKAAIVERNWNAAYASIYSAWKDFKKLIGLGDDNQIKIAVAIGYFFRGDSDTTPGVASEADTIRARIAQLEAGGNRARNRPRGNVSIEQELASLRARLAQLEQSRDAGFGNLSEDEAQRRWPSGSPAKPSGMSAKDQRDALERATKLERERLSLLGDTATLDERVTAKENELALARANNAGISKKEADAVVASYRIQLEAAQVSARIQLGVSSQQEITAQRLAEVYEKRARGIIKSDEEVVTAERLVRKEALDTAEAIAVRLSSTPQLTKLSQDASKLALNLDQELSSSIRGATSDLNAMARGTEPVAKGLGNIANKLLDAAFNAVILKNIIGPFSGLASGFLNGLLNPGSGTDVLPGALPIGQGGIGHNAAGTENWRGGWSMVGEGGPELRWLPAGSKVKSNADTMNALRPSVEFNVYNNAGVSVQTRETQTAAGGTRIETFIDQLTAKVLGSPGSLSNNALAQRGVPAVPRIRRG